MNSKILHTIAAAVTPDGAIPNTYYDTTNSTSCCFAPYVSAPSSPGGASAAPPIGYFYSAPSSPMHHLLKSSSPDLFSSDRSSFEFDFGTSGGQGDDNNVDEDDRSSTMSSADELFLNGQIRPMKLSSHLERPQNLAPLIDVEDEDDDEEDEIGETRGGRDSKKLRDRSLRRKARSLSPLRTDAVEEKTRKGEESSKIEKPSASSSRGTGSKRWVFLKDFIRSKSDGSNSNSTSSRSGHAKASIWSSVSFSHRKSSHPQKKPENKKEEFSQTVDCRLRNGIVAQYEAHYTAKRAQAEEMRRKTFLPYRQGLLGGCLGISSKGYGAMGGFTRALNSVSSR